MPRASVDASTVIDWGVASSALAGQTQSGDLHLVKPVATGVLLAVVDRLGHGAEAATAARTAVTTLDEHASESVMALLQRCHWAPQGSRGAARGRADDPSDRDGAFASARGAAEGGGSALADSRRRG